MLLFQEIKVKCCKSAACIPILLTVEFTKAETPVKFEWSSTTAVEISPKPSGEVSFTSVFSICRFLARIAPLANLYGGTVLEKSEIDHWLEFCNRKYNVSEFKENLHKLNRWLSSETYLVGHAVSLADICVWGMLYANKQWQNICAEGKAPTNVLRWFCYLKGLKKFAEILHLLPGEQESGKASSMMESAKEVMASKNEDVGKFVDLPGAEMGKVVVRFPPEASGFLHVGHAKAALLNSYYQTSFNGKLIMRFDDTNPEKEKEDFEKVILEDVSMLQIKPDIYTYTSDHFNFILEKCEELLTKGIAYVDDTDPETMKAEREKRVDSINRSNPASKNLSLWDQMKKGTDYGKQCCVRAKINMNSDNGCMRDPTLYRCKTVAHPRTGNKYNVYPTYDFACPIVDSIEGVTHALRTTEYHDRDEQYFWMLDVLGLRKPYIYEYSRLNMTNTVLSKRKLTWFVQQNIVDGWDDPRMPTVRGVLRKGMTVEGLTQFIVAQGSSRSVVVMEWDKIWAFNKKVIDPIAPRYNAVEMENVVEVCVENAAKCTLEVSKHPKNPNLGTKIINVGPRLLVDYADAEMMKVGDNVTFINWGNLLIKDIKKSTDGKIKSIVALVNTSNKDFKKTLKVTWVASFDGASVIPCACIYYDHLISKPVLSKDEDFKEFLNDNTKISVMMHGDPDLATLNKGDIIQIQRKGFFICDEPYNSSSLRYISRESPVILISIPDGTKDLNSLPNAVKIVRIKGESSKELSNRKKGKMSEKSPQDENKDISSSLENFSGDANFQCDKHADGKQNTSAAFIGNVDIIHNLNEKIKHQGEKIRNMKAAKVEKKDLNADVEILLQLKKQFKNTTGNDWKPEIVKQTTDPIKSEASYSQEMETDLDLKIRQLGDRVRKLKFDNTSKDALQPEINTLLHLKSEYKKLAGKEWKPSVVKDNAKQDVSKVEMPANLDVVSRVDDQIKEQGEKIRKLKSDNTTKDALQPEINILLQLKSEYKKLAGKEWKPSVAKDNAKQDVSKVEMPANLDVISRVDEQIKEQGEKIRKLKSDNTTKDALQPEINILLQLKSEYKKLAGKEWKPSVAKDNAKQDVPKVEMPANLDVVSRVDEQIKEQGEKIRKLKSDNTTKDALQPEINILLQLKSEYKKLAGKEWKPSVAKDNAKQDIPKVEMSTDLDVVSRVDAQIKEQGDKIRKMKSEKAGKDLLTSEINCLLSLKSEYKNITGKEWKPDVGSTTKDKTSKTSSNHSSKDENSKKHASDSPKKDSLSKSDLKKGKDEKNFKESEVDFGLKKVTRLGLEVKKEDNLADWYSQVITKGELIEYYDVSGCYILRPWAFSIWESITGFFDPEIKALGVDNCYFPMFVSSNALEREKTHIADFAPEVAWVTKSGGTDLAEPIAIRPTSETVMYPSYAKWIRSHRDLPLQLNQWCSVVRWEFKNPQPFIRTREFLWQEGHTAFATQLEATDEVYRILDLYTNVYEDLLAVPVIKGRKTEKEKFAGADFTTTVEAYVSANGRGVQGATSHHLGQNFSKMFEIVFDDPETNEKRYVYQNSWGLSTRAIGVMVMVHGDNIGLVIPPKVALYQVVIVPCGITATLSEADKLSLIEKCKELEGIFRTAGIRVKGDYRDNYSPGWKFNHWELKGVPLRVELGPRDLKKKQFVGVRRDTGEKPVLSIDNSAKSVKDLLDDIQNSLFAKAKSDLDNRLAVCFDWNDFCTKLDDRYIIQSPFCGEIPCEDKIKKDSAKSADELLEPGAPSMGAKSLCIPFKQPEEITFNMKCINPACQNKPKYFTLFGRSY